jgi:hypothetical protein
MDKEKRVKEIQESIRKILFNDWDPIGIKDEPKAQDEYDGYVGSIYRLLTSNASEEEIVNHLYKIERETMGIASINKNSLKSIVQKLLSINVNLQ